MRKDGGTSEHAAAARAILHGPHGLTSALQRHAAEPVAATSDRAVIATHGRALTRARTRPPRTRPGATLSVNGHALYLHGKPAVIDDEAASAATALTNRLLADHADMASLLREFGDLLPPPRPGRDPTGGDAATRAIRAVQQRHAEHPGRYGLERPMDSIADWLASPQGAARWLRARSELGYIVCQRASTDRATAVAEPARRCPPGDTAAWRRQFPTAHRALAGAERHARAGLASSTDPNERARLEAVLTSARCIRSGRRDCQ